jgi:hypothetical protein
MKSADHTWFGANGTINILPEVLSNEMSESRGSLRLG